MSERQWRVQLSALLVASVAGIGVAAYVTITDHGEPAPAIHTSTVEDYRDYLDCIAAHGLTVEDPCVTSP